MIPEWISGFVIDVFRLILWFVTHFILKMTDFIYNVILSLFNLHLGSGSEYQWIWDFYYVVVAITGLFILFRLVAIMFRSAFVEDTISKIGGVEMTTRVLSVGLVLSLIPVLLPMLSTFASEAAVAFPTFFGQQEVLPSDIIINSGMTDFDDNENTITIVDIPEGTHAIDFLTADKINDKNEDKSYKYLPNTENIAWSLVLAGCSGYVFLFVGVQIVTRLVGLFLKIALAPYALSGLVDPHDNAPSLWFRLCMSDFLTSFFQMVSIWIAMAVATHIPAGINGIGRGIIFVGAIFSIMIAPSGVAQLLGNDTGAQSGMQMIQSAMALGKGVQVAGAGLHAGLNVVGHVASGATTAGAAALYAAGRVAGGRSLNPKMAQSGGRGGGSIGSSDRASSLNGESYGSVSSYSDYDSGSSYGSNVEEDSGNYNVQMPGFNSDYVSNGKKEDVTASTGSSHNSSSQNVTAQMDPHGIATYSDDRVSDPNRGVGRITPTSRTGAMASTFAAHMYKASAERIFTTKQQRNAIKRDESTIYRVSNSAKDYGSAIKQANQKKLDNEIDRIMMKHKNLM